MSENKFTAADLDEEFHQMTREELLDEIAIRIEEYQELLVLNWKERKSIQDENKALRSAIEKGTVAMELAYNERKRLKHMTKTYVLWKYSCFGMVFLYIVLLIYLKIN